MSITPPCALTHLERHRLHIYLQSYEGVRHLLHAYLTEMHSKWEAELVTLHEYLDPNESNEALCRWLRLTELLNAIPEKSVSHPTAADL